MLLGPHPVDEAEARQARAPAPWAEPPHVREPLHARSERAEVGPVGQTNVARRVGVVRVLGAGPRRGKVSEGARVVASLRTDEVPARSLAFAGRVAPLGAKGDARQALRVRAVPTRTEPALALQGAGAGVEPAPDAQEVPLDAGGAWQVLAPGVKI